MTLKLTLALVMAFITAVIVGKFYVPWLRKMKAGQEIKENGPTWHMSKSGTPTMGGVIFISACTLVCLTVGFESMRSGDFTHIFVLLFALAFGAIGFLDDWEKLRQEAESRSERKGKVPAPACCGARFCAAAAQDGLYFDKALHPVLEC